MALMVETRESGIMNFDPSVIFIFVYVFFVHKGHSVTNTVFLTLLNCSSILSVVENMCKRSY